MAFTNDGNRKGGKQKYSLRKNEDGLTEKQAMFVEEFLSNGFNATAAYEIAYQAKDAHRLAWRVMKSKAVRAAIDKRLDELKGVGIADVRNRIGKLQRLSDDLETVKNSRAADAKARRAAGENVPESAETGLMIREDATDPKGRTKTTWKVDRDWIAEYRATLEQAAKDAGDRNPSLKVTGGDGVSPVQIDVNHIADAKAKLDAALNELNPIDVDYEEVADG